MSKFITTFDKDTADKLEDAGFIPVSDKAGVYVFLNEGEIKFSHDINKKNVAFTNTICG